MHYLYVDKIIEGKENALKEAENALEETESALEEAENALEEAENALEEAENELKEAKNELKEVKNELKEAENAIREMVFESIREHGEVSAAVREYIVKEKDINVLKSMYKAAARADSMKQFEEQIANLW